MSKALCAYTAAPVPKKQRQTGSLQPWGGKKSDRKKSNRQQNHGKIET